MAAELPTSSMLSSLLPSYSYISSHPDGSRPITSRPTTTPIQKSVVQCVDCDNYHESHFYLKAMRYFHQFQLPIKQTMYFIKYECQGSGLCHYFTVHTTFLLPVQEFCHQSSF